MLRRPPAHSTPHPLALPVLSCKGGKKTLRAKKNNEGWKQIPKGENKIAKGGEKIAKGRKKIVQRLRATKKP